ncbi:trihelix transcription factor ASIL2-like [Olea europaea var. sylvestris]|uniref:trihelix transcription factor ASIL2-like n=1 Tax=Olea europaea var. sylvestris TaxID=158386 RepID=UPI000C1D6335|nr:trihelix transcription factor ASIL2-like [Olea europaea var. sylvestris]
MATIFSPSSPSGNVDHIPTATLAVPSIAISASASRRLPPPCWSADETVALIDAYKDKWYSLCRGNLRAFHWQEVANDVAYRCPSSPAKTSVQCRHKMEKLRKRYRAEIQRAAAFGGSSRFSSSWVHFQRMHSMEKGPNSTPPSSDDDLPEEDHKNSIKRINEVYNNNGYNNQKASFGNQGPRTRINGTTTGCRIRIPGQGISGPSARKFSSKFDEMGSLFSDNSSCNFNSSAGGYGNSTQVLQDGFLGSCELEKRGDENGNRRKGDNGVGQVAAAIRALGEGFVRIEKVKMGMARRIEEMRMEMELKRTEMILGSQQRIVEAFVEAISERKTKKAKKMMMPEL